MMVCKDLGSQPRPEFVEIAIPKPDGNDNLDERRLIHLQGYRQGYNR